MIRCIRRYMPLGVAILFLSACGASDTPSDSLHSADVEQNEVVPVEELLVSEADPSPSEGPHQINEDETSEFTFETVFFGPHEWFILDSQDDKALIITKDVIERRTFDGNDFKASWETSSLRQYLNDDFIDSSFSEEEKERIIEVLNINPDNHWYGTDGGRDTYDKVFLLSLDEVIACFGDSGLLYDPPPAGRGAASGPGSGKLTDLYNGQRKASDGLGNGSWWWLRSPGFGYTAFIGVDGSINVHGGYGNSVLSDADMLEMREKGGVRPALWLRVD